MIQWKAQGKRAAAAAVVGGVIAGATWVGLVVQQLDSPGQTAIDLVRNLPLAGPFVSWLMDFQATALKPWIEANPILVIGFSFSLFAFAAAQAPWVRRPLHYRLWPDAPFFLTRGEPTAATPFVGRVDDLAWLDGFADDPGPMLWASLRGPPGRGKTRLATEWCARLRKRGWDAGLLAWDADLAELGHWVPRRHTVVVVDDAFGNREEIKVLFARLSKLGRIGRCVRLLHLDHGAFYPTSNAENVSVQAHAFGGETGSPHRVLEPLSASDDPGEIVAAVGANLTPERMRAVITAAAGEPISLMLLAEEADGPLDLVRAVARRAEDMRKRARTVGPEVEAALAAACFAPPAPRPARIDAADLQPLFAGVERLGDMLPPFAPNLVGDMILLRILAGWTEADRVAFARENWERSPGAAAASLRRLWLYAHGEAEAASAWLEGKAVATRHDESANPSPASNVSERGAALAALTARPGGASPSTSDADRAWSLALAELAQKLDESDARRVLTRLREGAISLCPELAKIDIPPATVEAAWQAMHAVTGESESLDGALAPLMTLIGPWLADGDRTADALLGAALVSAISEYGLAASEGREAAWALMGEAEARLEATYRNSSADPQIAVPRAMGAVNAISRYGAAAAGGRSAAWVLMAQAEARLEETCRLARLNDQLTALRAAGAFNAITYYGRAASEGREAAWAPMEEAEARLEATYRKSSTCPEVALYRAMGAVNAISRYGEAALGGREAAWGPMAKAEARLQATCRAFSNDPRIGLEGARGAFNAITDYGRAAANGRTIAWTSMADAEARMEALYRAFPNDPKIALHQAMGLVNALTCYGMAASNGREAARAPMAIAEARLETTYKAFSTDPQIALLRAKGAFNAINEYGKAARDAPRVAAIDRLVETVVAWRNHPIIGAEMISLASRLNLLDRLDRLAPTAKPITFSLSAKLPPPKPRDV